MVIFQLTEKALKLDEPLDEALANTFLDYIDYMMSNLTKEQNEMYNGALIELVEYKSSVAIDNFIAASNFTNNSVTFFPFFLVGDDSQVKYHFDVEYIDDKLVKGALEILASYDCFGRKGKWLE